ncbi:MAG: pyridoxamine 5'-phosphate oxidase family protein [Elusimicrobiota bacterium]|jgi:nitroimidazol reductase NimA-like FMN-containing flavoprotein (pyridoxamine 5'-phosphate oxidase superfamily)|nr:pyridoxamine 5'-phosphate oxidase family protein [Elusimicrobiota bacterium]
MRRADREVKNFDEIIKILDECQSIHIAFSLNDEPYSVPMNFGYEVINEKLFIYLHGAKEGKKHDILAQNPKVSFSGVALCEIYEAPEAARWSTFYKSIIGQGQISVVQGEEEIIKGLDALMKHVGYKGASNYPPQVLEKVRVLKIEVSSITGKQHLK